jgi:hypothetical protein
MLRSMRPRSHKDSTQHVMWHSNNVLTLTARGATNFSGTLQGPGTPGPRPAPVVTEYRDHGHGSISFCPGSPRESGYTHTALGDGEGVVDSFRKED